MELNSYSHKERENETEKEYIVNCQRKQRVKKVVSYNLSIFKYICMYVLYTYRNVCGISRDKAMENFC